VERGQVLSRPGCVTPHCRFEAEVSVLTKGEGERHAPFFRNSTSGPRTSPVELAEGMEMVMPGDNAELTIVLDKPVAMEEKSRFAIRPGNKTVGAGIVTRTVE
jgi:elongation factor Tu